MLFITIIIAKEYNKQLLDTNSFSGIVLPFSAVNVRFLGMRLRI